MFSHETKKLLQKKLPSVPEIVCERALKRDIDELVASILPPMKLALVDDRNTRQAYGDQVFRALKGRYATTHVTLEGTPAPDKQTVQYLRTQTLSCDAVVAIGSGTINDLCKYVSHIDSKPYIVFPTAASMNGYLSANASISEDGYKKTLPAHMPKAVFCDLSVIAAAPARLNKSGLGDSLARPTAQADWLLSHLLLGTQYDETPFTLLASIEPELFEHARGIALGDIKSIELLMETLLLSGLGMTIAGGSYPASQGEHMIAHAMEMKENLESEIRNLENSRFKIQDSAFHGETIAVTTLTMARMQEQLLRSQPAWRPNDFKSDVMIECFGSKIASQARKAFDAKMSALSRKRERGGASRGEGPHPSPLPEGEGISDWPSIAGKIQSIMVPSEKLHSILKAAEAPTQPQDIGWNAKDYKMAVETARYLRERVTFLDVMADWA